MKKLSLILSVILLSIGLLGCQQSDKKDEPAIIGEIVKIEDGRFLVESTTKKISDGRPDAIWFSTDDIEPLIVGQIVSVWTKNPIMESYPGQAIADEIEIKE